MGEGEDEIKKRIDSHAALRHHLRNENLVFIGAPSKCKPIPARAYTSMSYYKCFLSELIIYSLNLFIQLG